MFRWIYRQQVDRIHYYEPFPLPGLISHPCTGLRVLIDSQFSPSLPLVSSLNHAPQQFLCIGIFRKTPERWSLVLSTESDGSYKGTCLTQCLKNLSSASVLPIKQVTWENISLPHWKLNHRKPQTSRMICNVFLLYLWELSKFKVVCFLSMVTVKK